MNNINIYKIAQKVMEMLYIFIIYYIILFLLFM